MNNKKQVKVQFEHKNTRLLMVEILSERKGYLYERERKMYYGWARFNK